MLNNRCLSLHLNFPESSRDLIDIAPAGLKLLFNNNELRISKTQLQAIKDTYGRNIIPLYNGQVEQLELGRMINLSDIADFKILIENPQVDIDWTDTIINYIFVQSIHNFNRTGSSISGTGTGTGTGSSGIEIVL